jgi:MFS family permease
MASGAKVEVVTSSGPPPSNLPLSRWRWTVTTAFALGGLTVSAWGPRLPAIKASLDIGTAAIGLLLAGVTVGAVLGLLCSTPVLHWLGGRRALTASLLVVGVAMTVMGLALIAGSLPLLAGAFVVTGAGVGLLDVLINVEGAAVERAAGRTLMPGMHAAWSIGAAGGAGIGAACAALGISPAAQLIGEAVAIAVAGACISGGIPPGHHGEEQPPGRPDRDRLARLRQWAHGWLDWRLLLIGLVMLGCELGEGSANSWLTLAVRSDHGQSAAVAALFFTAFAVSEGITRIFAGPVVDRLGRARTVRITTALGVLGVIGFILAGNEWVVLLCVVLWAIGVSMGFPLGMSAAAESGPDPAARISVVASIGYFANLAGPPAIGAIAASAGLLQSLWLIAALFAAAFAAAGSFATTPGAVRDPREAVPSSLADDKDREDSAPAELPPPEDIQEPGDQGGVHQERLALTSKSESIGLPGSWHPRALRRLPLLLRRPSRPRGAIRVDYVLGDVAHPTADGEFDDGGLRRAPPNPLGKGVVLNGPKGLRSTLRGVRVQG